MAILRVILSPDNIFPLPHSNELLSTSYILLSKMTFIITSVSSRACWDQHIVFPPLSKCEKLLKCDEYQ